MQIYSRIFWLIVNGLDLEVLNLSNNPVSCLHQDNPEDRPTAKEILCNPVIRKYLQENKPISPEPFRIAGMHMRNEKVFKASIDEQDYPIELRDKAARVHGCADEG